MVTSRSRKRPRSRRFVHHVAKLAAQDGFVLRWGQAIIDNANKISNAQPLADPYLGEIERREGNRSMLTTPKTGNLLGPTLDALFPDAARQLTDDQLLARFVATHDEAAFATLVKRHGPMVLGVCRRVLGHAQDAENAFQATFLVLARKAASAVPRGAAGNWLYGVAYRTALAARSINARRRLRERPLDHVPHPQTSPDQPPFDLLAALDRELSRLPDKYRQVVVLCELEGRPRKEVARQLGLAEGTLSWRLATARKMLARRLARYGPEIAGATLMALLADAAAGRGLPPLLMGATLRAVAGACPPAIAEVIREVLKTMLITKLNKGMLIVLLLGLVILTCGALAQSPAAWNVALPARHGGDEGDPPEWRDDPLHRASQALFAWWPADGHTLDVVGSLHGAPQPAIAFDKGCRGRAFSFLPASGKAPVPAPAAPTDGLPGIPTMAPTGGVWVADGLPGIPPKAPTAGVWVAQPDLSDTFTTALWVRPAATISQMFDPALPVNAFQYAGCSGQRYAIWASHGGLDAKRAGCGISVGTNGIALFEHTHDHCPCVLKHDCVFQDWTHVAVVYTKAAPTLYINGAVVKTGERSRWTVFPGTGFGDAKSGYGAFEGLIDETTLFGRALTVEEIKAVMRATGPDRKPDSTAPPERLSDAVRARLWTCLGGKQAPRSLFAVDRLAAGGDETVRWLRQRLLPETAAEPSVEALIARLDDDRFATREKATHSLKQGGVRLVPKLTEALKSAASAEIRARLEQVLQHLSDEEMRTVRAIAVLGRIDTPTSRALLAEIAQGPETRPPTIAARGTLAQVEAKDTSKSRQ
jgi:RNA polymerase sigma factor (sigma-70 family)